MATRPKRALDPAEVDDMLAGTWQAPTPSAADYGRARDWVAGYDRCAKCDDRQPCLISFSGDTEWSPTIPIDDPVRLEIDYLRADVGRRTIVISTQCLDDLRSTAAARAAAAQTPRLFVE